MVSRREARQIASDSEYAFGAAIRRPQIRYGDYFGQEFDLEEPFSAGPRLFMGADHVGTPNFGSIHRFSAKYTIIKPRNIRNSEFNVFVPHLTNAIAVNKLHFIPV
jgi:hypothetical protein